MSPSTDLKLISMLLILISSASGVSTPLVLRRNLPFVGCFKAFAAGVILATGFVHILPDAVESLDDPSLSGTVWVDFPFAGFTAMIAALGTLVVDFVGIMVYHRKGKGKLEDGMHIVGVRAHVGEEHGIKEVEDGGYHNSNTRHIIVSQMLELGIVSHSVIVGLSLGVSQKTSMIGPLVAALSFHQFFQGFALGGCISQADFKNLRQILMACFFAITTPGGIAMGLAISSFYDSESPIAIMVQGVLNSVSAGILIYMALVDLIAADFLDQQKTSSVPHQVSSYVALFLGAGLTSLLAIWAWL